MSNAPEAEGLNLNQEAETPKTESVQPIEESKQEVGIMEVNLHIRNHLLLLHVECQRILF